MSRSRVLFFVLATGLIGVYLHWSAAPEAPPATTVSRLHLPLPMDCQGFSPADLLPVVADCDVMESTDTRIDPVSSGSASPIYLGSSIAWTTDRLPVG